MAKLKYNKFKSGLERGVFALYRLESNRGGEVVFAISGTDMSALLVGYSDIDFDAKSDEILSKISEATNGYFLWTGQDFFPCDRKEIINDRYEGL